jgi:hypothetical protein
MLHGMIHEGRSFANLAAACSGLRKLSIEIEVEALIEFKDREDMEGITNPGTFVLTPPTALVKKLNLDPFFMLQALQQLTVVTVDLQGFLSIVPDAPQGDVVAHLKTAIRDGFETAGKTAKVEVKFFELAD